MKNVIKITFAYLAAVIGAGFASGNEAVFYFVRFGNYSIIGVLVTALGFGVSASLLLKGCKRHDVTSFSELIQIVLGKKTGKFLNALLDLFMLILLAAMISAFAEMMHFVCDIPKTFSAAVFCFLCYCTLLLPTDKLVKWGGVEGIFIVVIICGFSFYMLCNRTTKVFQNFAHMVSSSAVYTAYNSFAVCPVICKWSVYVKNTKECRFVGVLSGILSFAALFLIWALLSIFYGKISLGDMPMITIASRHGNYFVLLYCVVMFAAILSSAVANGYGIVLKMSENNKKKTVLITMSLGWLISSVGFTNIVTGLYKYVGWLVLCLFMFVLIKSKINGVKQRKIEKNNNKQR